jgi:hypothetical protein
MSLCPYCGDPTFGPGAICVYHGLSNRDDWAKGNRIMCDFVHRGVVLPTPSRSALSSMDVLEDLETPLVA